MTTNPLSSLTGHYRRFLEAAATAYALEERCGLLAVPMALWMWMRSWRARKEAAAAVAEALQAFMQQLALLAQLARDGKLVVPAAAQARGPVFGPDARGEHPSPRSHAGKEHPSPQPSPSGPIARARWEPGSRGEGVAHWPCNGHPACGAGTSPSRCAGPSPRVEPGGKPAAQRRGKRGEGAGLPKESRPRHPSPARRTSLSAARCRRRGALAPARARPLLAASRQSYPGAWARAGPFQKNRAAKKRSIASISLRFRNEIRRPDWRPSAHCRR